MITCANFNLAQVSCSVLMDIRTFRVVIYRSLSEAELEAVQAYALSSTSLGEVQEFIERLTQSFCVGTSLSYLQMNHSLTKEVIDVVRDHMRGSRRTLVENVLQMSLSEASTEAVGTYLAAFFDEQSKSSDFVFTCTNVPHIQERLSSGSLVFAEVFYPDANSKSHPPEDHIHLTPDAPPFLQAFWLKSKWVPLDRLPVHGLAYMIYARRLQL